MRSLASTSLPSTAPATVAFARPAPIDAATSATVTGWSNGFLLPSGSVMLIMATRGDVQKRKRAQRALSGRPLASDQFGNVRVLMSHSRPAGNRGPPSRLVALQHER